MAACSRNVPRNGMEERVCRVGAPCAVWPAVVQAGPRVQGSRGPAGPPLCVIKAPKRAEKPNEDTQVQPFVIRRYTPFVHLRRKTILTAATTL